MTRRNMFKFFTPLVKDLDAHLRGNKSSTFATGY